jgi:hypothetical protein
MKSIKLKNKEFTIVESKLKCVIGISGSIFRFFSNVAKWKLHCDSFFAN